MHLRSRNLGPGLISSSLTVLAFFLCAGIAAHASQSAPAARAPSPVQTSAQPPLTVDRDPVPSPDPDAAAPPPATSGPKTAPQLGPIAREGGRYTLRENAYEVRLNASVFDQSGHSLQTLTKDAFHV